MNGMLGLEVQALKAASLISAHPLKVNCAGAARQPRRYQPQRDGVESILIRRAWHRGRASSPIVSSSPSRRKTETRLQTCREPTHALQHDIRVQSLSQPPDFPGTESSQAQAGEPAVVLSPSKQQTPPRPSAGRNLLARKDNQGLLQSPFRTRAAATLQPHRPAAARLWNPTNSTPRPSPSRRTSRKRRPSTPPPPPPVPLVHPVIDITTDPTDLVGTTSGSYPLLTLPEQRQHHLSASTRASLQIEGRASGKHRISLPKSVRHSYDDKRNSVVPPLEDNPSIPPARPRIDARSRTSSFRERARALSFGLIRPDETNHPPKAIDKGKGKAVMASSETEDRRRSASRDLERGPDVLNPRQSTTLSIPEDMGSTISSSDSSIMGDPDQPELGEEWGPQHPCFPHLNPHVPINSTEYVATRIIRVKRDWLVQGDLAPTFSNLYPEILDPAGVSEQEFRRIVEKLNGELVPIFSPNNWRNIVDGVLGLLTGWIWDDLGLTNTKSRLRSLESWIEKWNIEMEKTVGSEEGVIAPRIIPLRRTGYMNLDIQIPDPEIAPAASQPTTRSGPSADIEPAVTGEHTNDGS
ncbi:hypothetical protein AB5N19_06552 [Seiridium cardinale]